MFEILSEATGVIIAGSILFAAREMRRISNALRDLDYRVLALERIWLHREGIPERPGQSADHAGPVEVRGGSRKGGGSGPRRDRSGTAGGD